MKTIYRTKEFVETMCNLAFRCEAFIFANGGEIVFTSDNNDIVALNYAIGRKGKYKRVLREVNGQIMQITDRRDQYYARRKARDDKLDYLASCYCLSRELKQLRNHALRIESDKTTSGHY